MLANLTSIVAYARVHFTQCAKAWYGRRSNAKLRSAIPYRFTYSSEFRRVRVFETNAIFLRDASDNVRSPVRNAGRYKRRKRGDFDIPVRLDTRLALFADHTTYNSSNRNVRRAIRDTRLTLLYSGLINGDSGLTSVKPSRSCSTTK